jgi:hypothetical protein
MDATPAPTAAPSAIPNATVAGSASSVPPRPRDRAPRRSRPFRRRAHAARHPGRGRRHLPRATASRMKLPQPVHGQVEVLRLRIRSGDNLSQHRQLLRRLPQHHQGSNTWTDTGLEDRSRAADPAPDPEAPRASSRARTRSERDRGEFDSNRVRSQVVHARLSRRASDGAPGRCRVRPGRGTPSLVRNPP